MKNKIKLLAAFLLVGLLVLLSACDLFESKKYTITWKNHDNEILETSEVNRGDTPIYKGQTPKKEKTAKYKYTFIGWTPEIKSA